MTAEVRDDRREMMNLGVVMALPLVAVLVLAAVSLHDAHEKRKATLALRGEMGRAESVRHLIHHLQKERGATCLFVSTHESSHTKTKLQQKMWATRLNTSRAWEKTAEKESNVEATLTRQRAAIDKGRVQCNTVIEWYHDIVAHFIGEIIEEFGETSEGQLWLIIQAYTSWIDGKEAMGIKQALGSQFFPKGSFSQDMAKNYHEQWRCIAAVLDNRERVSVGGAPDESHADRAHSTLCQLVSTRQIHRQQQSESTRTQPRTGLVQFYDNLHQQVGYNRAAHRTASHSGAQHQMRSTLRPFSLRSLHIWGMHRALPRDSGQWILNCRHLLLSFQGLYIAHSRQLFAKISRATAILRERTKQLAAEEEKTNNLLHELLPPPIARLLKEGHPIPPQSYGSVTIFFSDIVQFTTLAAQSNPMQVVNMLNAFYTEFDEIIAAHDCYKVETIGDAFVIVSGLPIPNGVAHSDEIGLLSLSVREMTRQFTIPHMPHKQMMVRIGIHTGAVVAGVIGIKAPKYSLFGDAVNTASRMESMSEAMRIHLSDVTYQHLADHHKGYEIQLRGSCHIKGKGYMTTYWLEDKKSCDNVFYRRETQNSTVPGEFVD